MRPKYLKKERVLVKGYDDSSLDFWVTILECWQHEDYVVYEIQEDDGGINHIKEERIIKSGVEE